MAVTKNEILDTISNMSVMEVVELIEAMEEKFNVSAAAAVSAVAAPAAAAAVEEQTEFNVIMTSFGENKVGVIKAAPSTIKEALSKAEAEDIKKQLEEAGAAVDIK